MLSAGRHLLSGAICQQRMPWRLVHMMQKPSSKFESKAVCLSSTNKSLSDNAVIEQSQHGIAFGRRVLRRPKRAEYVDLSGPSLGYSCSPHWSQIGHQEHTQMVHDCFGPIGAGSQSGGNCMLYTCWSRKFHDLRSYTDDTAFDDDCSLILAIAKCHCPQAVAMKHSWNCGSNRFILP